jgi:hypothetical protein
MTYTFKLASRIARLRAPALALLLGVSMGCNSANQLSPTNEPSVFSDQAISGPVSLNVASEAATLPPPPPPSTLFSGVPLGPFDVPVSAMPSFSGAVRTTTPISIVAIASAARQAGARIVLRLVSEALVKNTDGTFSVTKWKEAIDRYAGVDLSSVSDGTIAGHLLVQNPQDPATWGGEQIPYATLEEMARYSRERWPGLPTIVKAPPTWLAATPTPWQYLDASSVVYSGPPTDVEVWAGRQAKTAVNAGLGLLFGINVLNGHLSARQLASWGSVLLAQGQMCGLVMYRYDAIYFERSDVKAAVATLDEQAGAHAKTSCRVRS